jgi:hypothetical protein
MNRRVAIAAVSLALIVGGNTAVFGNPSPPTNGGNGAGQSGQCTGNPDERPPGLDCAH